MSRCRTLRLLLAAAVLAAVNNFAIAEEKPTLARAQESGRGQVWGFDALVLLGNNLIQKELNLTTGQIVAVRVEVNRYLESLIPLSRFFQDADKLPPAERTAQRAELEQRRLDMLATRGLVALEVLTDPQRKRLGQVAFQLRGVEVFDAPEVHDVLGLDEPQRAKIIAVRSDIVQEARRLQSTPRADGTPKRPSDVPIRLLIATARIRAVETLTDEQKDVFGLLQGDELGFDRRNLQLTLRRE